MVEWYATGTLLYHKMLADVMSDQGQRKILEETWGKTPYMVDAFVGAMDGERVRKVQMWCHEMMGQEAAPMLGRVGNWQSGSTSINGWRWYGFRIREYLDAFIIEWKDDAWISHGMDRDLSA